MTPATVNAYYDPTRNQIGILLEYTSSTLGCLIEGFIVILVGGGGGVRIFFVI